MSPTLPPLNATAHPNGSSYFFLRPNQANNNTYYSDEEEQETGFSEIETVALACFLTLLPLIFGLISYFGLRHCWLRCQRTVEPGEVAKALETSERSKSSHALLNDQTLQMKSSESEFSVAPTEGAEDHGNQTSKLAANGSVITMTMKNNHLIVETEERLDEVGGESGAEGAALEEVTVGSDSTAIVHVSSPKLEPQQGGVNTGLSTSDLSSSSETPTTNRGYRYGNQEEYRLDDEEEDFVRRETECIAGSIPRPSLDYGPPPPPAAPQVGGLENPAFQVTTPAEPPPAAPQVGGLENPAFQVTAPAEPPPAAAPQVGGLENPAFQVTTPAEPPPAAS